MNSFTFSLTVSSDELINEQDVINYIIFRLEKHMESHPALSVANIVRDY